MSFDRLVANARVLLDLRASDKWSALQDLCRFAVAEGVIPPASEESVHAAVVARERSLSTGLELGLAVPHAFVTSVAEPVLIAAVAPAGIPWEALDGEPSRFVTLLLAPTTPEARAVHLQTLARLSGVWCDPASRAALSTALEAGAVRAILERG